MRVSTNTRLRLNYKMFLESTHFLSNHAAISSGITAHPRPQLHMNTRKTLRCTRNPRKRCLNYNTAVRRCNKQHNANLQNGSFDTTTPLDPPHACVRLGYLYTP